MTYGVPPMKSPTLKLDPDPHERSLNGNLDIGLFFVVEI
jgi:hypothetical protein